MIESFFDHYFTMDFTCLNWIAEQPPKADKSAPTVWSTHIVTHTPTDTLIILSKFIIMLSFP